MTNDIALPEIYFEAPIFARYTVGNSAAIVNIKSYNVPVRLWCTQCSNVSIFKQHGSVARAFSCEPSVTTLVQADAFCVKFHCAHDPSHLAAASFIVQEADDLFEDAVLIKVGQYPTIADIERSRMKRLRKFVTPLDAEELNRAIGLAAHGAGVGAFVYLRRIFERLLSATAQAQVAPFSFENWEKERMENKVKLLSEALPDFVVNNWQFYKVVSAGIHSWDEETCRQSFEVVKEIILAMLEASAVEQETKLRQDRVEAQLRKLSSKPKLPK